MLIADREGIEPTSNQLTAGRFTFKLPISIGFKDDKLLISFIHPIIGVTKEI